MDDPLPPTIEWRGDRVRLVDQRRLPDRLAFVDCATVDELCQAIATMAIRGAPALGVAAAMGVALAVTTGEDVNGAAERLRATRPTAVNLAWGLERALAAADPVAEACLLAREDVDRNRRLGAEGAALLAALTRGAEGDQGEGGDGPDGPGRRRGRLCRGPAPGAPGGGRRQPGLRRDARPPGDGRGHRSGSGPPTLPTGPGPSGRRRRPPLKVTDRRSDVMGDERFPRRRPGPPVSARGRARARARLSRREGRCRGQGAGAGGGGALALLRGPGRRPRALPRRRPPVTGPARLAWSKLPTLRHGPRAGLR